MKETPYTLSYFFPPTPVEALHSKFSKVKRGPPLRLLKVAEKKQKRVAIEYLKGFHALSRADEWKELYEGTWDLGYPRKDPILVSLGERTNPKRRRDDFADSLRYLYSDPLFLTKPFTNTSTT